MNRSQAVILIVDDNPTNLGLLFDFLDQAEFEVLVSQNGESAIKRAKQTHPDIMLLDVMMPGMDGFETCQHLKRDETTKDIPVIFMTALTDTNDKLRAFELGAVDYITKPLQPEEALARIRTHLTIQILQRELEAKNAALAVSLAREHELSSLKSRFVSLVSHQFKTPLTTIMLCSNILQQYEDRMPPEKRLHELHVIDKAVNHMQALLENVLTISKWEAGKIKIVPAVTNIQELCQCVIERFQAASLNTHTLQFVTHGTITEANIDPTILEAVLSNLLSNAIKYSPNGGLITFEFSGAADLLTFQVKDQGIGISAADQGHLFESFHRGENVGHIRGTGLGLTIVKQFVELHGGAVAVASELHRGTTFTVTLPPSQPAPENTA